MILAIPYNAAHSPVSPPAVAVSRWCRKIPGPAAIAERMSRAMAERGRQDAGADAAAVKRVSDTVLALVTRLLERSLEWWPPELRSREPSVIRTELLANVLELDERFQRLDASTARLKRSFRNCD
jgi:hypothetical protein